MFNRTEITQLSKDLWQDTGIYICLFLIVIIIALLIVYCKSRKRNNAVKPLK